MKNIGYVMMYHKNNISAFLTPFLRMNEVIVCKEREDFLITVAKYLGLKDCTADMIMNNEAVLCIMKNK